MRQTDEDFRREIESHLELETDRLIAEGLSPLRHAIGRCAGSAT